MTERHSDQNNKTLSAVYGGWPSSISAQSLVEGVVGLSALQTCGDTVYWLESRPEEAGCERLIVACGFAVDGTFRRRETASGVCGSRAPLPYASAFTTQARTEILP